MPSTVDKLICTKCELPTTLNTSQPSGPRNPWKRFCHSCVATDKYVQRQLSVLNEDPEVGPILKKGLKPVSTLSKPEAHAWKDRLNGYTHEQKVQWYKDEGQKRSQEERGRKRSFSDKGSRIE